MTWDELKNKIPVGTILSGKVLKHEYYGVYVDLGYEYLGLISIINFSIDFGKKIDELLPINSEIEVKVVSFKDNGCQIRLMPISTKYQRGSVCTTD